MAGFLLPDGTRCYTGVNCRKHGDFIKATQNPTPAVTLTKTSPAAPAEQPVETYNYLKQPAYSGDPNFIYDIEYEYDGYYCQDTDYEDDYCRDAVYEGLRITKLPAAEKLVKRMLFEENLSPRFLKKVKGLGIEDMKNWKIYGVSGYYGEEAEASLNPDIIKEINKLIAEENKIIDNDSLLQYAQNKGAHVNGVTPLAAIKAQLAIENKGKVNKAVQAATKIAIEVVPVNKIHIPNPQRFENVPPLKPQSAQKQAVFTGVLVKRNGEYELVDGYHRQKYTTTRRLRKGRYIVLS